MRSGAILLYKIPQVVIGENDTFLGEEDIPRSRGIEVLVLNNQECKELMTRFIAENPEVSPIRVQLSRNGLGTAHIKLIPRVE